MKLSSKSGKCVLFVLLLSFFSLETPLYGMRWSFKDGFSRFKNFFKQKFNASSHPRLDAFFKRSSSFKDFFIKSQIISRKKLIITTLLGTGVAATYWKKTEKAKDLKKMLSSQTAITAEEIKELFLSANTKEEQNVVFDFLIEYLKTPAFAEKMYESFCTDLLESNYFFTEEQLSKVIATVVEKFPVQQTAHFFQKTGSFLEKMQTPEEQRFIKIFLEQCLKTNVKYFASILLEEVKRNKGESLLNFFFKYCLKNNLNFFSFIEKENLYSALYPELGFTEAELLEKIKVFKKHILEPFPSTIKNLAIFPTITKNLTIKEMSSLLEEFSKPQERELLIHLLIGQINAATDLLIVRSYPNEISKDDPFYINLLKINTVFSDNEVSQILHAIFNRMNQKDLSRATTNYYTTLTQETLKIALNRNDKRLAQLLFKEIKNLGLDFWKINFSSLSTNPRKPTSSLSNKETEYARLFALLGTESEEFKEYQRKNALESDKIKQILSSHQEMPSKSTQAWHTILNLGSEKVKAIHSNWFTDPQLREVIKKVAIFENKFKDSYDTFVHGAQRINLVPTLIFSTLLDIKENTTHPDFVRLHIKQYNAPDEEETQKRMSLLKDVEEHSDRNLIFTNPTLFNNSSRAGECTANYFVRNRNISQKGIDIATVFAEAHVPDLLTKDIKNDIENLQALYNKDQYGVLYLFAIPKSHTNEMARASHPKGRSRSFFDLQPNPFENEIKKEICEVKEVLPLFEKNIFKTAAYDEKLAPSEMNEMIFVFPGTHDEKGILNPKSGAKIVPITTLDAQTQKEADELLQTIRTKLEKAYQEKYKPH